MGAPPLTPPAGLVGRWLFSHEEAGTRVYRPRGGAFPLSRRPRDGFDVQADGVFRTYAPGPTDASTTRSGRWTAEAGRLRVAFDDGAERVIEILEAGPDLLKVRG